MNVTVNDIEKSIKIYVENNGYTPTLKEWTVKNGFPCNKETLLRHFGKYNDLLSSLGYETYSYGKRRYNKEKLLNILKEAILKYRTSDYLVIRQFEGVVFREVYDNLFGSYFNAVELCGVTRSKMYLIKMYDDYNLEDEKSFIINKEFKGGLTDKQKDIIKSCISIEDDCFTRDNVCETIGFYKVYNNFINFTNLCILSDKTVKHLFKRQHRALDGHICDSYEEMIVDNFLYQKSIKHDTQTVYPNSRFKTDFSIGNIFVEYTKFKDNSMATEKYIETLNKKRIICSDNNIVLIEIEDVSEESLNSLYQRLLSEMVIE